MAQTQNLVFYHGDDFSLTFQLLVKGTGVPVDITGCVPRSDIRIDPADNTVQASFTATLADATNGKVQLKLTGTQVAALQAGQGYVWDVQLRWPDNTIKTYLSGMITVLPEVTRGS